MTIADSQKVDYLWKKLGYGAAKTDTNTRKKAPNEAIVSPLLIRGDKLWGQAGDLPTVIPASNTNIVRIYNNNLAVETSEDTTATANRTWKTNTTDWIPPEFGSTYLVKVYADTTGAANAVSTGTQLFATGSGNDDEWFFDYQAGLLHFIGTNLPSSINGTNVVYISGAVYVGRFGESSANNVAGTFSANTVVANTISVGDDININDSNNTVSTSNLVATGTATIEELVLNTVLATEYGGTGLTSFTGNGILFASNSSVLSFVTGTSGKVLQINSSGNPVFDDIDGGNV